MFIFLLLLTFSLLYLSLLLVYDFYSPVDTDIILLLNKVVITLCLPKKNCIVTLIISIPILQIFLHKPKVAIYSLMVLFHWIIVLSVLLILPFLSLPHLNATDIHFFVKGLELLLFEKRLMTDLFLLTLPEIEGLLKSRLELRIERRTVFFDFLLLMHWYYNLSKRVSHCCLWFEWML